MNFDDVWRKLLWQILTTGRQVSPRGQRTKELPMHTISVDMRKPVLTVPERKLWYGFMAAEAHWMLMGSDRLADLEQWGKNVARFSDDGSTFFGAYGPKILDQLDYVVAKLLEDPVSRQAGLTIWREKPPKTKDVPCTVAMFFTVRQGEGQPMLEANVFMRSNDAWLGTPYDVFNFSMVAHLVAARVNEALGGRLPMVTPGTLRLAAASSHLYEGNWEAAAICARPVEGTEQEPSPEALFTSAVALRRTLKELRESKPGDALRWWEAKP